MSLETHSCHATITIMAEKIENTAAAAPAADEAAPATNGDAKPERKQRDEGPPIEELFDLTKPIPKVSV